MKSKIILSCLLAFHLNSNAELAKLTLPNNGFFIANIPCQTQVVKMNSTAGVTNALQCRVDDGQSVCIFSINEQPLDIQSFNKWGFKFIEEVHKQFASQMDRNYRTISQKTIQFGGLGEVLTYELLRQQDGMTINSKGTWLVANDRMLRGAINCAPHSTSFMKSERELFFQSLSVMNKR